MRSTIGIGLMFCWTWLVFPASASSADPPSAEKFLLEGKLAEGEATFSAALQAKPDDQQARFGLGAVQFVSAVEQLGQNFYKFGLRDQQQFLLNVPFLRLPVPVNLAPEKLTYEAARQILRTFVDDLARAEATLAPINDPQVKLPLHVTRIKLDFVGQGLGSTTLAEVMQRMRAIRDQRDLLVHFDRADVSWLRGYCHLLSAMAEFVLAHDGREIFDSTAHLFFQRVESPLTFLQEGRKVFAYGSGKDHFDVADVIAFIHLIRMPVKEPQRMQAALVHLEKMLALSREMWQLIQAESDDDHEWIPNAKQRGELNLRVTQEMIDGWLFGVQEAELVLQGKRLIPFWRGNGERGVNLRRVFTEPRPFDLVLWAQGTAAAPYLEPGEITSPAVWDRLQRVFRGEFVVFALWFN